jgi:hypothetical protein
MVEERGPIEVTGREKPPNFHLRNTVCTEIISLLFKLEIMLKGIVLCSFNESTTFTRVAHGQTW